ncbi:MULTISPECIES: tryptophan halogenase family protein [Asticcacaulis]|uniref:tryptophan halogenase family protein n=1 Tax=Asticcacaulis TaxID=76890 RepID=UPI001AEAB911|nr:MULTISPECIES: tryptophan halogenase family protein [Asticcacaulis]MBP2160350.1 tryptophan halogenase [Asticcacaulis solisilvae]MDR6801347.1 tryptophan halogenase [Asticcacaulis sp. BE141]
MAEQVIRKVVIAGGGTAGWCVATALGKLLGPLLDITLVESAEIGIVGVGEATIPTIRSFHRNLGIDERDFMRNCQAGIKLGISFDNWSRIGDHYFHSFGFVGKSPWLAPFHHMWLHARSLGFGGDLQEYCLELLAGEAARFYAGPDGPLSYAYHFDTALYGPYLRRHAEAAGVRRIEGRINHVDQDAETGFVTAISLESGQRIEGDLFIDCTGFRGILIEQTLKTGYEDWDHWLANNSAWACQTELYGRLNPYTSAIAHSAGWRWEIPLQHRIGNGFVYSNNHMSDDEAHATFMTQLQAKVISEPIHIRFRTGRRKKIWNKNVIAFGLASGFIEPLESTNIHLMQICAVRLAQMFPFEGIREPLVQRFNTATAREVEKIRNFVIMHYKATERDDNDYWRARRDNPVPDDLALRMQLFRETGHLYQEEDEIFRIDSWLQVLPGQRVHAEGYHHAARLTSPDKLRASLDAMRANVAETLAKLPDYETFLRQYCAAEPAA